MKTYPVSHVEIEEKPYLRDMSNKALVSKDMAGLQAYRDRKVQAEQTRKVAEEMEFVKGKIGTLETDIGEIKHMLRAIASSHAAE